MCVYQFLSSCVSAQLCPFQNVQPWVVCCRFIRTTMFTNCLHIIIRNVDFYRYTRFHYHTFHVHVLPLGVYGLFTRTNLFTTIFTIIIFVCSFKIMCVYIYISRFVLIGCCVSELHTHLLYCVHIFVSSELEVAITSPSFINCYTPSGF